jgi:hypothetical protein
MSERLDEIKARLAAATPGPWRWSDTPIGEGATLRSPSVEDETVESWERAHIIDDGSAGGEYSSMLKAPDADLIAHAPADLAFLLEEVETAHAVERGLSQLLAAVAGWLGLDTSEEPCEPAEELREAIERLRTDAVRWRAVRDKLDVVSAGPARDYYLTSRDLLAEWPSGVPLSVDDYADHLAAIEGTAR